MTELEKIYEMLDDGSRDVDEKTSALAQEIREELESQLEELAGDEDDRAESLEGILKADDALLEEFVDRLSLVNICEQAGKLDASDIEKAYLSMIDTLLSLSKTINPLSGFNKERLRSALDLIRDFEERYWPVSTRITSENISAFENLIPEQLYYDIQTDRKHAVGALRHMGDSMCAAGVVVYTILHPEEAEAPVIRIDWLYVHEKIRQTGVGNFLMAMILDMALQNEGTMVTTDLFINEAGSEEEDVEQAILEDFLDSWRFEFNFTTGRMYVIRIGDMKGNKYLETGSSKVSPLSSLGSEGESMIRAFLNKPEAEIGEDIRSLPCSVFDQDLSCVIVEKKHIMAALLFHRLSGGNLKLELLKATGETEVEMMMQLLGYAYETAVYLGDEDKLVYGYFNSEAGFELARKIIPKAKVPMMTSGYLRADKAEISNEEWDEMRRAAGLSDDKLPGDEDALDDENMTKKEIEILKRFLTGSDTE